MTDPPGAQGGHRDHRRQLRFGLDRLTGRRNLRRCGAERLQEALMLRDLAQIIVLPE